MLQMLYIQLLSLLSWVLCIQLLLIVPFLGWVLCIKLLPVHGWVLCSVANSAWMGTVWLLYVPGIQMTEI